MQDLFRYATIGATCLTLAFGAFAQSSPNPANAQGHKFPGQLGETLKDIPQANVSCRKEDFGPKVSEVAGRSEAKPDGRCAIVLDQLSSLLNKPETILVDVRSHADFETSHIDGAVNFSESEIRAKRYLSNRTVVLIGDGKADQDIYALCADLKSAGFKQTRVLKGGMPAWLLETRPVIGVAVDFSDAAKLSSGELFQESRVSDNVIITLPGMHKLGDLLPTAVKAPADDIASIKNFIQTHKRKKGSMPTNIILVAGERFDTSQLGALAKVAQPESLLVYSESESNYRQFMRVQNAMWSKQAKGPTRPRCGI